MGDQKYGDMVVRISVVGHASPRWKGAANAAEADHLNQALSSLRATNVHAAVEAILKRELPGLPIEVPSKGVGSRERFPTASEDNAAVDRSVLVTVELTTTTQGLKGQARSPRHVYVPSTIWTLTVYSMWKGAGLGYVQVFLRVGLRNPYSGKERILSGWVRGGSSAMDVGDSFKIPKPSIKDPFKPIGKAVTFETRQELDFDNLKSLKARLGKVEVKFGLKTMMTYLVLEDLDHDPNMLIFDHTGLSLGTIGADAFLARGTLAAEGPNPGDYLELARVDDLIPTESTQTLGDGVLLSFPTGKAGLNNLADKDLQRLRQFVTQKAKVIGAFSETFKSRVDSWPN